MPARIFRYAVSAALAVSGAVLAGRAIAGPFRLLSVPVNSPLNAQSIFSVSVIALLLINSRPALTSPTAKLRHPAAWLMGILFLTAATLWPALGFPLVFDEYTLARYGQGLNTAMAKYYFSQPGGDGFYRPIGVLSFGLDASWAGHDPFGWHVLSLVLHLANIVLVWQLADCLLGDRLAAIWAAALFALHGTVLQTATYLAARFDALSVFFVLAGLVLFVWYLEEGHGAALAASLVCALLGFLTKEVAFSFPLLAAVAAGRKATVHGRALAAHFVLAAAAFAYRYRLMGGIGGYRDPLTGAPDILRPNFLGHLKGFGLRAWSTFCFPLNWSHKLEPWLAFSLLVYMAALAWIAVRTRGNRPKLIQTLAFTWAALVPIAHLLLVDANLLGAGRYYLALPGFAMLLGVAIQGARMPERVLLGVVLVGFQVAALRHNRAIWGQTAELVVRTCTTAARLAGPGPDAASVSGLPREIDGVPFLGIDNGFEACVAFHRPPTETRSMPHREFRWDADAREIVVR